MVRKKLLTAAVALTLCTSLIMPMAGVNMQEVMAESRDEFPSIIEAPEEWNGVDDFVIHIDKGAGKYELGAIENIDFIIYRKTITLSQDAYIYDVDTGKITINGKKLFDAVSKYCGENEQISWGINKTNNYQGYKVKGSITYTGEPNEQRKPSIIEAPEEWNGVDDFVIHIDKGAGKYELETIGSIEFRYEWAFGSPSGIHVDIEDIITYDVDKVIINGKELFNKIGSYCITGEGMTYSIGSGLIGSFTYTGELSELHYPAIIGKHIVKYENSNVLECIKDIEINSNIDDIVIPIDKGTGEYEMVSCYISGITKRGGWGGSHSDDCYTYDSSKGGLVINGKKLYSFLNENTATYIVFKLVNGEEFDSDVINITVAEPDVNKDGFVIREGILLDYLGEASEIIIPETVTTIKTATFLNLLKEAKVTVNGNHTVIEDGAFGGCYNDYSSSSQELILNGDISYLGYMKSHKFDTVTVNGMIGNMSSSVRCNNLIVNGDIAYISEDVNKNYLKDTKIYCKENSNILRYVKENNLNYEIIEKQPNEPQIQSANNEFDGTKDLIFKLDNTSDIKEIKDVYLLLSNNVYDDANILMYVQYVNNGLTNEFEYNPETGEVTLYKELVSKTYGYDYVSIGNTFLGHIVYTTQDGTEKHAFGDWNVKILDKSPNATAQYMYRLPDGKTSVTSSDMQDLIKQNETQDVCITANGIAYTFAKGTMKVVEGKDSYDFGAEVIREYGVLVNPPFTENEFAFRINYNYEGDLPAMTDITIPAGIQWAGKTLYYYEVTESGFYKYISSSVVDEAGNFTITQSHCSDYVALTKLLDEKQTDTSGNTTTGTTNDKESPQTGDKNMIWLYVVLAAGTLSTILITKHKKTVK